MNISSTQQNDVTIVTLDGRLDVVGAPEIEEQGQTLIQNGCTRLLLDMSSIDYISSAGLRSLLALAKAMKSVDGKMVLCCLSAMAREVMGISGFDKILAIAPDRDAALNQLK